MDWAEPSGSLYPDNLSLIQKELNNSDIWEVLNNKQCIEQYTQDFIRQRSDVVTVIASDSSSDVPTVYVN